MNRDFKGIWIPAAMWLTKGLSVSEKVLWAEIDSLYCPKKGGCHASNDYLCEFMGVKIRRLQDMLSKLKDMELLMEVGFNGRERLLKALHPDQLNCSQPPTESTSVHSRRAENCMADVKDPAPPIYKDDNKEDNKEREGDKPPTRSTCSSKKINRALHVDTTNEDHEKLFKQIGEKKRSLAYQELSEWKQDTPRSRWKKDDYRAITRWVLERLHDNDVRAKKMKGVATEVDNIAYCKNIVENYNITVAPRLGIILEELPQGLNIRHKSPTSTVPATLVKYGNGFVDRVDQFLMKWKLK